ncbi:MAG: PHP domain-containing protein [Salinirussus sp.]
MVAADLHIHTTNSDGTLDLDGVLERARAADLMAVAVTDHDRLHPALQSPITEMNGLVVVHGIELRVEAGQQRLDLLGYGVRRTAPLTDELERLQADRIERGRAMVTAVENCIGIDLELDIGPGFGRPDVARAVAAKTDYNVQGVFDELIGEGCPAYVARNVPEFARGAALLQEACKFVSLAHPLRANEPSAALERAGSLDAVELYYPYDEAPDLDLVHQAIDEYDLLVTGGSDAHDGSSVGTVGLDASEWSQVQASLT